MEETHIKMPIRKYRVFLVTINANIINFAFGTCVGWSSPTVPKLRDHTEDSPLNFAITKVEEGWITSIITIGAMAASLVAGPMAGRIGRKWALLISSLFFIVSYIALLTARSVLAIYVARLLQGVGGGIILAALPVYIGEIATDDCRGALGSLMTVFIICGILYAYCIGPYVSYIVLQWCCIVIPVIFLVTFSFMPESPYFYAVKGYKMEALRSLQFLRGQSISDVKDEMIHIQTTVDEAMANKGNFIDIFRNPGYRKALFICCGLLAFQQLSGTTVVTFNSQTIFSSAKSTLDPAIATIILGLVQLVANLLTPFIIERIGRRIILMISAFGMCLALFALGTFFYVQAFGDASAILWLPIPAVMCFNVLYSFGFGPIPYTMLSEMFPSNIKSIALSIATLTLWLVGFVVTRWFPELNALGPYYAFWVFGSLCVLAFFFVIFVVMETKGLSLQMIQDKLHS